MHFVAEPGDPLRQDGEGQGLLSRVSWCSECGFLERLDQRLNDLRGFLPLIGTTPREVCRVHLGQFFAQQALRECKG